LAAPKMGPMVAVRCEQAAGGWRCQVEVDADGRRTEHTVKVAGTDLDRWGNGRPVEELVRRSFEFLLEREPASSILREFDLAVIPRYFPEFDQRIKP